MSNLIIFHSYNLRYSLLLHGFKFQSTTFCFIISGLVPSPSPPFDSHDFSFCSIVSLTVSSFGSTVLATVSASVLASNDSLFVFLLSSHLYKYWCKLGGSIEVSLHLCALFFCLMVFFPLSMFVSVYFLLWCGWLLRYIYFLNHFC